MRRHIQSAERVYYRAWRSVHGRADIELFPQSFSAYLLPHDRSYLKDQAPTKRPQEEVLLDVSRELYPDHKEVVADSFLALKDSDPERIRTTLARLGAQIDKDKLGRPGLIGRRLFPDRLQVARDRFWVRVVRIPATPR